MTTQIHENWVPTTDAFGARLALIRWRMGWNMKEAALACGFSQQSWREWELSGREPRGLHRVAEQIADRTGVDDYWIMTGKQKLPSGDGPEGQSAPGAGAGLKSPSNLYNSADSNVVSLRPASAPAETEWAA